MYGFNNRSEQFPYLLGDVFRHKNGAEIIIIDPVMSVVFFKYKTHFSMLHNVTISSLSDLGFEPVQEFIEESKKILEWGLYAPRKLENGTWCALTPLMTTTAICADYSDTTMYVSRYCFQPTSIMGSKVHALLWLSNFKTELSLPIGNVAYRGYLGKEPIADEVTTHGYYKKLHELKYEANSGALTLSKFAHSYADSIALEIIKNGKDLMLDSLTKGGMIEAFNAFFDEMDKAPIKKVV